MPGWAMRIAIHKNVLLVILTAAGSAICWWPVTMVPSLDLPQWSPLIVVALLTAISAILSGELWLRVLLASSAGTFAGLVASAIIWPPADPEAAGFLPFVIIVTVAAAAAVSLIASLTMRKLSALNIKNGRLLWIIFGLCLVIGPVTVAITPILVARRVARNDQLAELRFGALKRAAELAAAQNGGPDRICEGPFLKQHYSGPRFSETDWGFIKGNYVRQDGYMFGIWCHQQSGYTIDVRPFRGREDGTRNFCTDESGRIGCGSGWVPFREACTPC